MKIQMMSKGAAQALRTEIEGALAEIGAKYGLEFELGTIRYEETSFRSKIEATVADLPLEDTKEGRMYVREAYWRGLKAPLGAAVVDPKRGRLKIVGWRNSKNTPVILQFEADGTKLFAGVGWVQPRLAAA